MKKTIYKIGYLIKDCVRMLDKIRAILFWYFFKESLNNYYRRWRIVKIGNNTWISANVRFDMFKTKDAKKTNEPLIEIGNNCIITEYTQFITHDSSLQFFLNLKNKKVIKKWGKIIVEDNIFIGAQCLILPGVKVQHDSLIGAGSVVTKDVEPNSVYVGNPAKKLMSLEEYIQKGEENKV